METSPQVGTPVEQASAPRWQVWFVTPHEVPVAQSTQVPPGLQTLSVPQGVPATSAVPVSTQTAAPLVQEVLPAWQAFAGVQAVSAAQAPQTPVASQTLPLPQLVPGAFARVVSVHTGAPEPQAIAPS
jgi:hypothetical protein